MVGQAAAKPRPLTVLPPNALRVIDGRARRIVCDEVLHEKTKQMEVVGFRFNRRIADWPICRQADEEGWSSALRSALIDTLKRMMANGVEPDPAQAIELICKAKMDDGRLWVDCTRKSAERYMMAREWQAQHLPEMFNARKMVRNIVGKGDGLTEQSRRMVGEA